MNILFITIIIGSRIKQVCFELGWYSFHIRHHFVYDIATSVSVGASRRRILTAEHRLNPLSDLSLCNQGDEGNEDDIEEAHTVFGQQESEVVLQIHFGKIHMERVGAQKDHGKRDNDEPARTFFFS